MERSVNDGATTYGASFQANVQYPWADYAVNMTEILGTMNQSGSEKQCKVSQKECDTQRKALISIFDSLQLDFNSIEHKCHWDEVVCNENNLIVQILIGKLMRRLINMM